MLTEEQGRTKRGRQQKDAAGVLVKRKPSLANGGNASGSLLYERKKQCCREFRRARKIARGEGKGEAAVHACGTSAYQLAGEQWDALQAARPS